MGNNDQPPEVKKMKLPVWLPKEVRQRLAGQTVTLTIPPLLRSFCRGEFPPTDLLPEGCNAEAWQKVRNRLEGHTRLTWKIFFELRPGLQRISKAKASLPKSKRRAEAKRIFDALLREIEAIRTMADSVPDETRQHCVDAAKHCTAALRPLVEFLNLDEDRKVDGGARPTVAARHAFSVKIHGILEAGLPGYDITTEADYSLLRNICLTAGMIQRVADFPEDLRKKLSRQD